MVRRGGSPLVSTVAECAAVIVSSSHCVHSHFPALVASLIPILCIKGTLGVGERFGSNQSIRLYVRAYCHHRMIRYRFVSTLLYTVGSLDARSDKI